MNVDYPPEAEGFRAQVRTFLHRELPAGWRGLGALSSEEARAFTAKWRVTLAADALAPGGRSPIRHYRTDDPDAPNTSASWTGTWMTAISGTIYAGTSEIQRNILAESVLGLPKEARG